MYQRSRVWRASTVPHATLVLGTILAVQSPSAWADLSAQHAFSIPAQPLSSALLAYSKQADVQVVGSTDTLVDFQTSGVSGEFTGRAALRMLLGSNPIMFEEVTARSVRILPQKAGTRLNNASYQSDGYIHLAQADSETPTSDTDSATKDRDGLEQVLIQATATDADALRLRNVSSTASRLGVETKDFPASVYVVDQSAFQRHGYRDNIDAVSSVVGFSGMHSSAAGAAFSTRGLTRNDIVQLTDGVHFTDSVQVSRAVDSFNLSSIEVIKGPSSVLFAEGAIGGAINYISKDPSKEFTGNALLSYSRFDSYRAGVGVGGPIGDGSVSYRFDASRSSTDGFVDGTPADYTSITGAVRYDVSPTFSLTLYLEGLHDKMTPTYGTPTVGGQILEDIAFKNYTLADANMEATTYWTRLRAEWNPNDTVSVNNLLYAYKADRKWTDLEGYSYLPATRQIAVVELGLIRHNQDLVGDRIDVLFKQDFGGHENRLVVGLDGSADKFFRRAAFPILRPTPLTDAFNPQIGRFSDYANSSTPAGPALSSPGTTTHYRTAAFLTEDQFSLLPNLKLVAGLRKEYFKVDIDNPQTNAEILFKEYPFNYRGGLVYEFSDSAMLYGQYSTAQNPPQSFTSVVLPVAFKLQKAHQLEVGTKQQWWNDRIQTTLAWFDLSKDRIVNVNQNGERVGVPSGKIKSNGIEFTAALFSSAKWTLGANYAYTKAHIEFPGNVMDGKVPANVPRHTAVFYNTYHLTPDFEVGSEVNFVSSRFGEDRDSFHMGSYTLVGVHATYTHDALAVTLRGRNITDKLYAAGSETFVFGIGPATTEGQVYVGEPRSAQIELTYKF